MYGQEQPKEQAAPATEQKTEEQPAEAKAPENRFARMRRLNALIEADLREQAGEEGQVWNRIMGALDQIVRSGKALYVGISNYYDPQQAETAIRTLKALGTPMLIHQPNYSIFNPSIENGLDRVLEEEGVGCIAFAPLANGLLTNKYLKGIPADSRAAHDPRYLKPDAITPEKVAKIAKLNALATERGESLAQLALQWVLRRPVVTSALIGASKPEQILENIGAPSLSPLTDGEIARIDAIMSGKA